MMDSPFSSYNPATGNVVWTGPAATSKEIEEAVKVARKTLSSWSALTFEERADYLRKFAEILRKKESVIATIISEETGKPLWDAKNEIAAMIGKIAISLEAYLARCPEKIGSFASGLTITRHKPLGVVAIFGPFNFPAHLPNGHIVPALLAGNTVIFKPSELAPKVAEETVNYWNEIGLPKGVLHLIQGGPETGRILSSHKDIDGLFFTGSERTGKKLSELYGHRPEKLLALELGGNNPLVIGQIHDVKAAAYITVQSAFLTSGQRCTCARRLILTEEFDQEGFMEQLLKLATQLKIGAYTDRPEPFMGPVINEAQALRLLEAQDRLISLGGVPLLKMEHLKKETGFVSPGIIDVTDIKDRPDDEFFGPLLQVIKVKDIKEAVEVANSTRFGLTAGILTDLTDEHEYFYSKAKAGIINWNTPLTGASSAMPFGGIGCSGNHRPSAFYAADYCAYPVASMEAVKMQLPSNPPPGITL